MVTMLRTLLGAMVLLPCVARAAETPAPYVVVVDYTAPSENIVALRTLIEGVAKASITEPGCRRFDVVQPLAAPDRITLFEVFDDQAAFKAHSEAPHFKQFVADSTKLKASRTAAPGGFLLSLYNP